MIEGYKIAALCLSRVQDEYTSRSLIKALNKELNKIGYKLFIFCTDGDLFWNTANEMGEQAIFDLIDFDRIDALIIYDESIKCKPLCEKLIAKANEKDMPVFVAVGHYDNCINLNFDYVGGFEMVVRHVLDHHNKKRIHFLAGIKGNEFSETRFNVVKRLTRERGLRFDERDVSYGDFWDQPTREAMEKLYERDEELPEAIICANDSMALAVCSFFLEKGIKVPDKVMVTGFDGIDEVFFSIPQITTCRCSFAKLGERIAELLSKELSTKELEGDYYIEPSLMLSESCGCHPKEVFNMPEYISRMQNRFTRFQDEERVMGNLSATIQTCDNIYSASIELKNIYMYDMCVLLKKEALDESINPVGLVSQDSFGEEMILVCSANDGDSFRPAPFKRHNIIPHFSEIIQTERPLVFTAVHSMRIPLGYACFFYNLDDYYSYNKIFQITNMLNTAFGGYRNMHYQRYLQSKIEDSYKIDPLTGYYNRNGFFKDFQAFIDRLRINGGTLVIALADLDNLKYINDTFGHAVGDKAICAVANALRSACPSAIFCRFGGDEMLAVKEKTSEDYLIRNRLNASLDQYNRFSGTPFPFSASLGIYETDDLSQMNFENLLVKADELMYEEKRKKKLKVSPLP